MKRKNKFRQLVILFVTSMTIFSSCKKDDNVTMNTNSITDIVVSGSSFTTLESAVIKANLQGTLSGPGPYTVFAPNDAAFTASGITATVLNSLTPAQVKDILLYHTISSKINAADVPAGPNAKVITAGGDSIFVTRNEKGVFVNGIKVNAADIAADNGVIHGIEKVLIPAAGNIVETAVASKLDSLVKAVTIATSAPGGDPNLAATLSNAKLTVFAPTNSAFTQLLGALNLNRIEDIPVGTLLAVLRYHVVGGRAFSSDLANGNLSMLAGGNTTINLSNGNSGGPTLTGNGNNGNKSNITATNIVSRNGVVHVIDRVLLP